MDPQAGRRYRFSLQSCRECGSYGRGVYLGTKCVADAGCDRGRKNCSAQTNIWRTKRVARALELFRQVEPETPHSIQRVQVLTISAPTAIQVMIIFLFGLVGI